MGIATAKPTAIKFLITIFFLIIFSNVFAQSSCDTIFWSAHKLIPADFKDIADTGKTMVAFTMVKTNYKVIPQEDGVIINSGTYFLPCRSWLNSTNTKNSLAHEQLHFDLAEYHRRRLFLKRISETVYSAESFSSTYKIILKDIAEQRRSMETDYDRQTSIGRNTDEQISWNSKVAQLIKNTEAYTTNMFTIKFK